ncbi:MAG: hypothetical protein EA351_03815 [Gemmatimonadales bacterium]|nr:MAG: hypothetical protein EA351_03815 [Gemmatimonadales bacterium]
MGGQRASGAVRSPAGEVASGSGRLRIPSVVAQAVASIPASVVVGAVRIVCSPGSPPEATRAAPPPSTREFRRHDAPRALRSRRALGHRAPRPGTLHRGRAGRTAS